VYLFVASVKFYSYSPAIFDIRFLLLAMWRDNIYLSCVLCSMLQCVPKIHHRKQESQGECTSQATGYQEAQATKVKEHPVSRHNGDRKISGSVDRSRYR
jgi:hypothetical protein